MTRRSAISFVLFALVTYSQHIRPLLDWRCAECHAEGSGLVLTRFPFYSDNTNDQTSIVTAIINRVQGGPSAKMPAGVRPKLTAAQVEIIRQWRDGGLAP